MSSLIVSPSMKARQMKVSERPTDMLLRQFDALRKAIRYRNPETGKRHHCHEKHFSRWFIVGVREFRDELIKRGMYPAKGE